MRGGGSLYFMKLLHYIIKQYHNGIELTSVGNVIECKMNVEFPKPEIKTEKTKK